MSVQQPLTESTFLFDLNVEYKRKPTNDNQKPMWRYAYRLGQVQIKAPSYQVALLLAQHFADEVYECHIKTDPNKSHKDSDYRVIPQLGTFTVNDITMHKFGEV